MLLRDIYLANNVACLLPGLRRSQPGIKNPVRILLLDRDKTKNKHYEQILIKVVTSGLHGWKHQQMYCTYVFYNHIVSCFCQGSPCSPGDGHALVNFY